MVRAPALGAIGGIRTGLVTAVPARMEQLSTTARDQSIWSPRASQSSSATWIRSPHARLLPVAQATPARHPRPVIPAHAFGDPGSPDVEEFRRLVSNRELALFAEVSPQYDGVMLSDGRFEPYFVVRERHDGDVEALLAESRSAMPCHGADCASSILGTSEASTRRSEAD